MHACLQVRKVRHADCFSVVIEDEAHALGRVVEQRERRHPHFLLGLAELSRDFVARFVAGGNAGSLDATEALVLAVQVDRVEQTRPAFGRIEHLVGVPRRFGNRPAQRLAHVVVGGQSGDQPVIGQRRRRIGRLDRAFDGLGRCLRGQQDQARERQTDLDSARARLAGKLEIRISRLLRDAISAKDKSALAPILSQTTGRSNALTTAPATTSGMSKAGVNGRNGL